MDNSINRKKTRQITLGTVKIGGGAPIAVQSMCNTDTRDAAKTLEQIGHLEQAGCEIVRLAVPDEAAAQSLGRIRKGTAMPLVADIHFDYRLAIEAVKQWKYKPYILNGQPVEVETNITVNFTLAGA